MKDEVFKKHIWLNTFNTDTYIKYLENTIITEGKTILNSIQYRYLIVSHKNLRKYEDKHGVRSCFWRQINPWVIYKSSNITSKQYKVLLVMRAALNRQKQYILYRDQFEMMEHIRKCEIFRDKDKDVCKDDGCKAKLNCSKSFVNWFDREDRGEYFQNIKTEKMRCLKENEELIRPNHLDEECEYHHIRFILTEDKKLERCSRYYVVAFPTDLHRLFNRIKGVPSDLHFFAHQFMTLQVVAQLYDGFDELLDYLIEYDDFLSYKHYKYWENVIEK